MELQKAIEERRSIRAYKDTPVTDEQITEIIRAGMLAPSAKNGQPWLFRVIRKEEIEKLCSAMENLGAQNPDVKDLRYTAKVMRSAPAVILVFLPRRTERIAERAPWQYLIPDLTSVGACFENMSLKACDMGLGSLWVGHVLYADEYLRERFGKEIIAGALVVGYPDESPAARPRRDFDKIVTFVQ